MRAVLLTLGFFLTPSLWAMDLPYQLCDQITCGEKQELLFDRVLEQGTGLADLSREKVYSGVCHWNGIYNPEHEHHAGFFWYEAEEGAMAFKGRFSYYSSENPYGDYSSDEARRDWFQSPRQFIPESYDTHSFYNMNPDADVNGRIWYWFRTDSSDPNRLYLLTIMGRAMVGVCELYGNN